MNPIAANDTYKSVTKTKNLMGGSWFRNLILLSFHAFSCSCLLSVPIRPNRAVHL